MFYACFTGILLLILIVTVLAITWDGIENSVRVSLERRVSERFGGTLRIGHLGLDPIGLHVVAEEVFLEVPEGDGPPLRAKLRRGSADLPALGLLALPGGRVHLSSLQLDGLRIELDKRYLDARAGSRPPRDLPVDLRIDAVTVQDGSYRYDDIEIPLEVSARDLSLEGTWEAETGALAGVAGFETHLEGDTFSRPYPVRTRTRFRLTGSRLEALDIENSGPGLQISGGRYTATWGPGKFQTGSGDARADLGTLRDYLADRFPPMAGILSGEVRLSKGSGPVQIRGDVHAESFLLGNLEADRATARAVWDPGRLRLTDLEGESFGGEVRGSVEADLKRGEIRVRVEMDGRGMNAAELFEFIGRPLPMDGSAAVSLRFSGDPGDTSTWDAEGDATILRGAGDSDAVPLDGRGTFEIREGRLRVQAPQVAAGRAGMAMEMSLDLPTGKGMFYVEGESEDARVTHASTLRVLRALEVPPSEYLDRPLEGTGSFSSRTILGEATPVTVNLDLADGSWGGEPFRHLVLAMDLEGDRLELTRFDVQGDGWSLGGSLVVKLESGTLGAVDLEARSIPATTLLRYLGADLDIRGGVSGGIDMTEGIDGLEGTGRIEFSGGEAWGEPIEKALAILEVSRGMAVFSDAVVEGPGIRGTADVEVDLDRWSGSVTAREVTLELSDLRAVREADVDVNGVVRGSGRVDWDETGVRGRLETSCESWTLLGQVMEPVIGRAVLAPEGMELSARTRDRPVWRLAGNVAWDDELTSTARLVLNRFRIDLITEEDLPPAWARVTGDLEYEGSLIRPEQATVTGSLDQAEVLVGSARLRALKPVPIRLDAGGSRVGPVRFQGEHSDLSLALETDSGTGAMRGSVKGYLHLGVLALLIPDTRSTGRLEVDLEIGGTLQDPDPDGTVAISDGRIRFLGFPQPLEHVEATLKVEGEEADIAMFRAILGGGELAGNGGVALEGLAIDSYLLGVDGANVRVAYPEDFRGVYEGHLEMRGDSKSAMLRGNLRLLRGAYTREFDMTQMFGIGTREYSVEEELELPLNVFLDVDLRAEENVWLRNELAELESGFDLHLGGDLRRPEVTGRLWMLEGGRFRFRHVDYTIRTGTMDFVDLERVNPYLNMNATTEIDQYEIQLRIEGTFDRIQYELSSNPSLSQQDIIALLTTGRTLQDLTETGGGTGAGFTGDLAAGYFAGALTDRFEQQLQKLLGLERVQISPFMVRGSADPTARITLGKEVADNLYLIYSSDLSVAERQLYQIEWQATPRFRFTAERDTTGGIGGDFLYFTRFWLSRPPAEPGEDSVEALPAPTGVPGGAEISEIVVLGIPGRERDRYLRELPLKPGAAYRRSLMFEGLEAIRADMVKQGRLQASVAAEAFPHRGGEGGVRVVYRIDPGPRTEVSFSGISGKDEKRLRSRLRTLWSESFFTEFLFEDSRRSIEKYFRERGRYAVDVGMEETPTGPETGDSRVVFRIDPGEEVRIREVTIRGNDRIDRDRILRQMFTRPTRLFSRRSFVPGTLEQDLAAIRNLYRDQGFLAAAVLEPVIRVSVDSRSVTVELEIVEGEQFTVAQVVVPAGIGFEPADLVAATGLKIGEVFTRSRMFEAESALRSWLDFQGYPDARVSGVEERGESSVMARFEVVPGIAMRVGAVEIEGNRLTQDKIIRRELLLAPGDPISREKILRTQHRLYKLGIFRSVRIDYVPMEGEDPSVHRLRIRVEEAKPLGMTLGAGYDTEGGARGTFSITHDNVGGYDRTLSLQGRASGIDRRVQLLAEEPRLFTHKWPALVSLLRERREEVGFTVERDAAAIRVENSFRPNWTTFLRYSFQNVDLPEVKDLEDVLEQKLEDLKLGDLGLSLVCDTRDDPLQATRGSYGSLTTRYFGPAFFSDESFVKALFQGSVIRTFRGGSSYAAALRVGVAQPLGSTTIIPISERFFAGGDSTVRGFPRDELGPRLGDLPQGAEVPDELKSVPVGGEALLVMNHEFRYPVWGGLKAVVFYDVGNAYLEASDLDSLDVRHVLGAGLRLETPIGPLRLEYGRKLDREEGESRGELFIAIGSAF